MIRDKRGEGGFMEAIVAFSAVTVALTLFLGLLAYTELGNAEDTKDLDTEFVEKLTIEDGQIIGYDGSHIDRFIERNRLNGAEVKVTVAGYLSNASLDERTGATDGNNVGTITGTFSIHSDDNRTFVASYEVIYWWD